MGKDCAGRSLFSAFAIEIKKNIVQAFLDVSGNATIGKSSDGEVVAHIFKFFPMTFFQFLTGNQLFQLSFGAKHFYFMKHILPP